MTSIVIGGGLASHLDLHLLPLVGYALEATDLKLQFYYALNLKKTLT